MLLTTTRGGGLSRVARGAVGLSLVARGTTGYCAVKAALTNRAPRHYVADLLGQRPSRQHGRDVRGGIAGAAQRRRAAVATRERPGADHEPSRARVPVAGVRDGAAGASRSIWKVCWRASVPTCAAHTDDAMRALIDETEKMWRVCAANVRDAAVTASVQRIIHYKIAGYGAIAAYAKALVAHGRSGALRAARGSRQGSGCRVERAGEGHAQSRGDGCSESRAASARLRNRRERTDDQNNPKRFFFATFLRFRSTTSLMSFCSSRSSSAAIPSRACNSSSS